MSAQDNPNVPHAPTYNQLFTAVNELRAQIQVLERQANSRESSVQRDGSVNSQTVMDFRIVPDLNQTVRKFTGSEGSLEAEDWFDTVDGLANINNWPLNFRLQFVRSNITGAARSWFGGEKFESWEQFKTRFYRIFVREARLTDRWDLMKNRVQSKEEHLIEYFMDKVRLCKNLELSFAEIRDHVIQSLYSRELAIYALGKTHSNSDELLSDLQDWQRLTELRNARFATGSTNRQNRDKERQNTSENVSKKSSNRNWSSNSTGVNADHRPSKIVSVESGPSTKTRVFKCYNCFEPGHVSRECTHPRRTLKCGLCQEEGHTRGRCPQLTVPTTQGLHAQTMREVSLCNSFIKSIHVNGKQFQALVDTGCSVCLIRSSAAVQSGAQMKAEKQPLYVVGDMNNPGLATIGEMVADISIGQVNTLNHHLKIVPDQAIPTDLLIGRDWLDLPNVNFYKDKDEFVIVPTLANTKHMEEMPNSEVDGDINDIQVCLVDEFKSDSWRAHQATMMENSGSREQCTRPPTTNKSLPDPITIQELKVGDGATASERQQLLELVNEFRDVFAKNLSELGCTDVLTMDISEYPGSVPVNSKPFRTSPSDRKIIAGILQEWRDHGIISDSESPYASPVILVNKSTGEKRLCIDYRKLNKQTICRPYPMPDIDSQLSILSGGNIFTALDLSNGYLQIPLTKEAQDKTAFVTEEETAKFNRMPFGLCDAPGVFQKLMNIVFKDLREQGTIGLYLDDIILPATDWADLMKKLPKVFATLRKAKLTLKPSKCTFGAQELEYLGFKVSKGRIQPGNKVAAISTYPVPQNVHEVRQFLGLAGFFRRFVQNYASKSSPLTTLLKKDSIFIWQEEQQQAFDDLKSVLTQNPVLQMYSPDAKVTQIHTDACAKGLAGVLLQGDSETTLHIVYCVSKTTTEAERKYHSGKLELFAIIWTLGRLRPFLLGLRFTVLTDCQALVYLNIHKTTKPQIARWFDSLHEFDFDIKYRPGARMAHVDALSRTTEGSNATTESMDEIFEKRYEVCLTLTQLERVKFMQDSDVGIRNLIHRLSVPDPDTHEEICDRDYEVINGLLYRKSGDKRLFVVPKPMRKAIVISAHELSGHFSVDRTLE